jgi:hypothetical protein
MKEKLLRWKPSSAGSISTDMMTAVRIGDKSGAVLCNDGIWLSKLPVDPVQCRTVSD